MTTHSTPEKQNSPAAPDNADKKSAEEGTGFFNRVRRNLNPEKTHPSEEQEIVVMDEDSDDTTQLGKV
jgi:hypothetical protein